MSKAVDTGVDCGSIIDNQAECSREFRRVNFDI